MLSPKDFHELYMSVYEAMGPDERALKRELVADKRASKMEPTVASRYASSEARSAARADKKSKGKHIHGTVDESAVGNRARNVVADQRLDDAQQETQKSVNKMKSGDKVTRSSASIAANKSERTARAMHSKPGIGAYRVSEAVYGGEPKKKEEPKDTRMIVTKADKTANTPAYQKFKAGHKGYRAAPHLDEAKVDEKLPEHERATARDKRSGHNLPGSGTRRVRRAEHEERRGVKKEELEMQLRAHLRERALDATEKREKESVFKALKPSKLARTYPEKSPEEIRSLRYAISTSQAKKNMDTSRSDKRYGVER